MDKFQTICKQRISIHAPREGSDALSDLYNVPSFDISIHAPREGSDVNSAWRRSQWAYFYPRSP